MYILCKYAFVLFNSTSSNPVVLIRILIKTKEWMSNNKYIDEIQHPLETILTVHISGSIEDNRIGLNSMKIYFNWMNNDRFSQHHSP